MVDAGAVRIYEGIVSVSNVSCGQITAVVDQYPLVVKSNPGHFPSVAVPDFDHILSSACVLLSDGSPEIRCTGFPDPTYRIQASDDSMFFEDIGNVTADSEGLFHYKDSNHYGKTKRFYRVAYP